MDSDAELAIVRRAYAKQIMAAAMVDDERVEAAFAAVRREAYLGPGPWPVPCPPGARLLRCTPLSFSYGYRLHFRFRRYTVASSGLAATAERNEV